MHYTLLPDSEHAIIHREYRTRVAIIFCFAMVFVGVVGIVSLFPAYIFSVTAQKTAQKNVDSINSADDKKINLMKAELSRDAILLATVAQYKDSPYFSNIISDIVGVKGTVKFSSMALERLSTTSISVIIQGVSPTRSELLALQKRLEALKKGNIVDLPISSLTKSTAIQFSMKVTEQIP